MNIEAKILAVWCLNVFEICEASRNDLQFHGQSDGLKSNKNSEDYAFLYTFPYTGYGK